MGSSFDSLVSAELQSARKKHAPLNSAHEGYAVILEELDEFKEWVWKKREQRDRAAMLKELVSVGAMCQRLAEDIGLVTPDGGGSR